MISKDKVRIAISINKALLDKLKFEMDPDNRFSYSQLITFVMEFYLYDKERK